MTVKSKRRDSERRRCTAIVNKLAHVVSLLEEAVALILTSYELDKPPAKKKAAIA